MMRVLLFGPITPPINGQSVAFTLIANSLLVSEKIVINSVRYKNKIINVLYLYIRILFVFVFCKFSTIYFTSSRSTLGFFKDFPLLILGKWSNKRIINHLHGADFKLFYDKCHKLKPLVHYAYKCINTSIVLLEEMKNQYVDFPLMNIEVVENCYVNEFDLLKDSFSKKYQIIFLSNIMKSKGVMEFLEACDYLLEKYPKINVVIAGKPLADLFMDEKKIFSIFMNKYNVLIQRFSNRIQYLGILNTNDKIKCLFESSIFILPSYYVSEAFPLSIIEAMRSGNAIITTKHNYLPYIINDTNGLLIEPMSAEAIIIGVDTLLSNKSKLNIIQQNNINVSKSKYSQANYIQKLKKIILQSMLFLALCMDRF